MKRKPSSPSRQRNHAERHKCNLEERESCRTSEKLNRETGYKEKAAEKSKVAAKPVSEPSDALENMILLLTKKEV
jgi:hypothetical protein